MRPKEALTQDIQESKNNESSRVEMSIYKYETPLGYLIGMWYIYYGFEN